jgi:unconventional prefoldin RPB5 interactor 1
MKTIKEDLAEIPSEGEKLEDVELESPTKEEEKKEEEKKLPAEEEKKTEEETPFHKHPRFKELVEEKNQYKKDLDELREEVESKFSEMDSQSKTKSPEWFSEAFGDQPELWDKFQAYNKSDREAIKNELREELKAEKETKEEEVKKQSEWVEDQVNSLKDEGLKFEKNDLLKVMWDYKPTDDEGNLDFKKGYEIMEALKKKDPEKANARKEIVSEGKSKSEPEDKKWKTPQDMKGVGWDNMS